MGTLYLTEDDIRQLIAMPEAIGVVRRAFSALARGEAMNVPRSRAKAPGIVLHNMHAAADYLRVVGAKLYTTTRGGAQFLVMIYAADSGELVAMIEADQLGRLRTGAASGVATDFMARPEAKTVGLFGAGKQARTQLGAICAVRDIEHIAVYTRTPETRTEFAKEMSHVVGVEVEPVADPAGAVEGREIVITATTTKMPLFDGELIELGTHLNVVGSNDLRKAEIDVATVARADRIVCDAREACRSEAGDFVAAIVASVTNYEAMSDLAEVVSGEKSGRADPNEVTLFKSVGLAIEDLALGYEIWRRACERGVGRELEV